MIDQPEPPSAWRYDPCTDLWECREADDHVLGSVSGALLSNATPERRARIVQLTGLPLSALSTPPAGDHA